MSNYTHTPARTLDRPNHGKAITGFVLGLFGVLTAWPVTFWLAFILGTLGIIFGALGFRYGLGKAGLILGILAVILSIVALAVLISWAASTVDTNTVIPTTSDLCTDPAFATLSICGGTG